jgi:hypothetical protein
MGPLGLGGDPPGPGDHIAPSQPTGVQSLALAADPFGHVVDPSPVDGIAPEDVGCPG